MTRRLAGLLLLAAACSATDSTPPGDAVIAAALGQLAYPTETWLGQSGTKLSYVVTNTGSTRWIFGATASMGKPDNGVIDLPVSVITLSPGQSRSVSWDLPPWRPAGRWDVRVSILRVPGDSSTRLADSGWLADVITAGFQVRYHTSTPGLSQADADNILADGERLLRTFDGGGDVPCDVTLVQFGAPASFSTGDGIIDDQGEFNTVLAIPGSIKIVNQINWCNAIAAGILGCAPIPGYSSVVREAGLLRRDRELWAHEYGHNMGLVHYSQSGYLMFANYSTLEVRNKVTTGQCAGFRGGVALVQSPVPSALVGLTPVQDFARQDHVHGVPYDEARKYSSSDVPQLLRMLSNREDATHWVNVVAVLGIIGDASVVAPLIAFVHEGTGSLTPDEYRAKSTVLIALGYLVNHTGNRLALDYLLASARFEVWSARRLEWSSPFHATTSQRDARLARTALLGLALSGAPDAGALLRSRAGATDEGVLEEFRNITQVGLARYYSRARPGQLPLNPGR